MTPSRRFSWNEMRRYWTAHGERWHVDDGADPDGLGNVCYAGAPLWLNRHYARFQRMVFDSLLERAGDPSPGARALDVGCGVGRWCRALSARGYDVTGIDLQPDLVVRNRERMPRMRFENVAVQDFDSEPFEMVTSVTVIQHVPYEEQARVLDRMRALTAPGGHALVLENVRADAPHVFPHSPAEWRAMFERAGFQTLAISRYDYSPFLRATGRLRAAGARVVKRERPHASSATPEDLVSRVGRRDALSRAGEAVGRVAAFLDRGVEPLLIRANMNASTVHCGFLFRAGGGA